MKTIPLTQGLFALVDDADFEAVNQFKWHVAKRGRCFYAARHIQNLDGKRTKQYMHQFLMPGVLRVDHRDGAGLNNQREGNLRPATNQQNCQGACRKKLGATSKFRGVGWDKKVGKWRAQITASGKNFFLGYFTDEEDAARAYDAAAQKYFTDGFIHLNFP